MKYTLKTIFYSLTTIIFITFIVLFYFSEENKKNTNRIRSIYNEKLNEYIGPLPFLINDTQNIIYFDDNLKE